MFWPSRLVLPPHILQLRQLYLISDDCVISLILNRFKDIVWCYKNSLSLVNYLMFIQNITLVDRLLRKIIHKIFSISLYYGYKTRNIVTSCHCDLNWVFLNVAQTLRSFCRRMIVGEWRQRVPRWDVASAWPDHCPFDYCVRYIRVCCP